MSAARPSRRRRILAACGALATLALAAACVAGGAMNPEPTGPRPVAVQVLPYRATPPAGSRLTLLSAVELRGDLPEFGGLSALEVSADGARIVAISDRGRILEARLERAGDRIVGLRDATLRTILQGGVRAPDRLNDSEGLAIADPDLSGPLVVGFERRKRIERIARPDIGGEILAEPAEWERASPNLGPEAVAIAPDGRILAVMEAPADGGTDYEALWIAPDGAQVATRLPRPAELGAPGLEHSATGADFDDQGRLWLVARRFEPLGGFAFAIVRYRREGDGFDGGEVLLRMPWGPGADNAEGVAAWTDALGRRRLLVVTDDNLNLLQKTILYDFVAPPG